MYFKLQTGYTDYLAENDARRNNLPTVQQYKQALDWLEQNRLDKGHGGEKDTTLFLRMRQEIVRTAAVFCGVSIKQYWVGVRAYSDYESATSVPERDYCDKVIEWGKKRVPEMPVPLTDAGGGAFMQQRSGKRQECIKIVLQREFFEALAIVLAAPMPYVDTSIRWRKPNHDPFGDCGRGYNSFRKWGQHIYPRANMLPNPYEEKLYVQMLAYKEHENSKQELNPQ